MNRSGIKRVAIKFSVVAAKVAINLLTAASVVCGSAPVVVRVLSTSLIYTLASTHRIGDYDKLNIVRACKMSYWLWAITLLTDVVNAVAVPLHTVLNHFVDAYKPRISQ